MKILRISGRNLASLAGDFAVDFEAEPLVSSGLFAISGPTGAGKSTLLDALCLALYGTTPRLPRTARGASALPDVNGEPVSTVDPRNLLRRGAAEGHAEVDFVGSDGLRYRARWSVRRSRNKPGGPLQAAGMTLHLLPEMAPVGGTKSEVAGEIVQRIGLSFEQFTRAVLLAQNEFSAFLRTDENERGELLETLTGSAVYSVLSRRAYERCKREQESLRLLTAQLDRQAPLPPEARAALDAERAQAELALAALEARRALLEQQQRWHQELDKLRLNQANAQQALAAARAEQEAAAPRRQRLATLELVQGARPLLADATRLESELAQAHTAHQAGQQELAALLGTREQAQADLDQANAALAAAELAQREAAPGLDAAKALDAAIAALAPAQQQAQATLEQARKESARAAEALQSAQSQLANTRAAHQAAASWLAAHTRHETLALQWERWDQLLDQAVKAAQAERDSVAALAQATEAAKLAAAQDQQANTALERAAQLLREREEARRQASNTLAGFDVDALRAERGTLDQRREQLAALDKTWTAWSAAEQRRVRIAEQAAAANAAHDEAARLLAQAERGAEPLAAAAAQAERTLAGAELACADSVETLRAQLAEGDACPVCGGTEHPYRARDPGLHAVLEGLAAEVTRCRGAAQENASAQAAHRTALAGGAERLAVLARERDELDTAVRTLAQAWDAHPLAAGAPPPAQRDAWLASEQQAYQDSAAALDARAQAAHQAALARDAAQQACDGAQAAHARAQEQAQAARAAAAQLRSELGALGARREAAAANLAAIVNALDEPLAQADGEGWQERWREDPAGYRRARTLDAQAWSTQSAQLARHQAALLALEATATAATQQADAAQRGVTAAADAFTQADLLVKARQKERAALFDGKPAKLVEQALAAAVAQARAQLATTQATLAQAAQREAALQSAIAQGNQRCVGLQAALDHAREQLQGWINNYAQQHGGLDPVADVAALKTLLATASEAIAAERAALAGLDAHAARAAAVLAERTDQCTLHLASAAPGDAVDGTALAAALEQVNGEHATLHASVANLRLQVAQDDERHTQGRALLAEIDQQRVLEQKWARLSDLIGSADGKRFRNYAQQFTLDVLLGYANRHLAQLARRYRLERVLHPTGPSLALMVRDQDMGGEVRPVNSLSGGETFLVSLALALGLASLSSNRVRVESLFIDEGFGSLDSDTLGVAMDALDALQAQGRKVGVISHVQEMTERIAARIVVRPAGGGASAVSVS
jgi:DNA repair protein SbcC/Rad50